MLYFKILKFQLLKLVPFEKSSYFKLIQKRILYSIFHVWYHSKKYCWNFTGSF